MQVTDDPTWQDADQIKDSLPETDNPRLFEWRVWRRGYREKLREEGGRLFKLGTEAITRGDHAALLRVVESCRRLYKQWETHLLEGMHGGLGVENNAQRYEELMETIRQNEDLHYRLTKESPAAQLTEVKNQLLAEFQGLKSFEERRNREPNGDKVMIPLAWLKEQWPRKLSSPRPDKLRVFLERRNVETEKRGSRWYAEKKGVLTLVIPFRSSYDAISRYGQPPSDDD